MTWGHVATNGRIDIETLLFVFIVCTALVVFDLVAVTLGTDFRDDFR